VNKADFKQGLKDISPMALAYSPIAMLWGAVAARHGLSVPETMFMSLWVYSGAAQFVAMDIWNVGTPFVFFVLTILTVSLRHVLMSASVARHISVFGKARASVLLFWLTDEAWAMVERRALERPITPSYFLGVAIPLWPVWFSFSAVGAWFGNSMGDLNAIGLDFAFAAMFIAVLAGFWKGTSTAIVLIASAAVAVLAKLYLPGAWYIIMGGIAGMLVAMAGYVAPPEGSDAAV
jgi:4-azaleucine resistance transporter AzlC